MAIGYSAETTACQIICLVFNGKREWPCFAPNFFYRLPLMSEIRKERIVVVGLFNSSPDGSAGACPGPHLAHFWGAFGFCWESAGTLRFIGGNSHADRNLIDLRKKSGSQAVNDFNRIWVCSRRISVPRRILHAFGGTRSMWSCSRRYHHTCLLFFTRKKSAILEHKTQGDSCYISLKANWNISLRLESFGIHQSVSHRIFETPLRPLT